ncbi:helix-turn-helix transcriptional regulator [Kribbella solani]|uniref:helix-turn-helix domain-containing protein n=1 Tax=Kribbella solani TaxID=236067 RepID=UPI0029AB01DE|nr:helix-turn-helix transcriptional regulator [Kribbella solani]MDX3000746.1 helix-turn-helix transcriptional regulator [Kribbella solani]
MPDRRLGAGARIAAYRRLNRLTQRGLAARANVSHSLLTKVETGSKPASQSFLAACARALSIPVTHLTGQPFIEQQAEDRLSGPLNDLRASLENFDLTLDDLPVRLLADIRPDVRDMVLARRDAQYARILGRAPALIDELVQQSQILTGHDAEQAHHLLVQLYRSAADVAYALGLADLVSLLLARMDFSASRSGDPYQVATYRYMRAYSTFTTGRHEVGQKIIRAALADIDIGVRAADPVAVCAAGNLRLRASILATRQGDAEAARGELAEARHLADMLGREVTGSDLATGCAGAMSFGATNVAIHSAAVELELGNHRSAVQLAKQVHVPSGYPPDRIGHHHIDTARAHLLIGDNDGALTSILKARQVAPQKARYHPSVRETIASLVHTSRHTPDSLIGFAHWAGVQL